MNFEEIELQQAQIEDQLESLQLAIKFLYQEYTYHHKNNESELLKAKLNTLLKANERLKETIEQFKELCLKLEAAKKIRNEANLLLESAQMEYATDSEDEENNPDISPNV